MGHPPFLIKFLVIDHTLERIFLTDTFLFFCLLSKPSLIVGIHVNRDNGAVVDSSAGGLVMLVEVALTHVVLDTEDEEEVVFSIVDDDVLQ